MQLHTPEGFLGPQSGRRTLSQVRPVPRDGGTSRRFGKLITGSPTMQSAVDVLSRLAQTDVTITLVGETGTGKDVLSHAVHGEGSRSRGPFVVLDCGAVAANLAES